MHHASDTLSWLPTDATDIAEIEDDIQQLSDDDKPPRKNISCFNCDETDASIKLNKVVFSTEGFMNEDEETEIISIEELLLVQAKNELFRRMPPTVGIPY